jgi:hypothetical protein
VWLALVVLAAVGAAAWGLGRLSKARAERARREEEQRARAAQQQYRDSLGPYNLTRVAAAEQAVGRVLATEAARDGWLGDVDFTADLAGIVAALQKAHGLRQTGDRLAELSAPTEDDLRLLAEARGAAGQLEYDANARIDLIERCAVEAGLVDASLHADREAARIAAQRSELHSELSGLLYGVEISPRAASGESQADQVMARVAGYRALKQQIGDLG